MCHVNTEKGAILSRASGARSMEERALVHQTPGATNSRDSLTAVHRLLWLMGKPPGLYKPPEMRPKNTHLWELFLFHGRITIIFLDS